MAEAEEETSAIAKRTLWSLAALGFTTAASLKGGPVAGAAAKGFLAALEKVRVYTAQRAAERLAAFHLELMRPCTEKEQQELLEREFTDEDFALIFESVIADVEHHKAPYYAKLFRALVLSDLDGSLRSHLVRSFRALSVADFRLIERFCEATRSEARTPDARAPENLIKAMMAHSSHEQREPLVHASAQNLITWGYLVQGQRTGIPWPTTLAKTLAKIIEIPEPKLQR